MDGKKFRRGTEQSERKSGNHPMPGIVKLKMK